MDPHRYGEGAAGGQQYPITNSKADVAGAGLTLAGTALTVTAGGGAAFAVGDIIQIEPASGVKTTERLTVTLIVGDVLTVTRGTAPGTTIVAHAAGQDVLIGLTPGGVCVGKGDDNPSAGVRVPTGKRRIDIFTGDVRFAIYPAGAGGNASGRNAR